MRSRRRRGRRAPRRGAATRLARGDVDRERARSEGTAGCVCDASVPFRRAYATPRRPVRLALVRIARFTTGEDPQYGVVTGEVDDNGIPDEDCVVVALAGDPMYVGMKPTSEEHRLVDVRLLAPVLPRSKVVGIGKNYAAHAAEMGGDVPERAVDVPQAEHLGRRSRRPDLLPAAVEQRALRGRAGRGDRADLPRRAARAGDRRDLRLHRRQRRDRPRPAEERRAVHPGARASTRSARSGRGSRPTSTRTTSPRAAAVRTWLNGELKQDGSTRGPDLRRPDPGRPREQRDDAAAR